MNFVSFSDLYRDIEAWERQLPAFDAICGVPRSGMIPAAYLALRRNIRLVAFNDLIRQPEGAIERAAVRIYNPAFGKPAGNRLLIVDDSVSDNGVTFKKLRGDLKDQKSLDITYGAVYAASKKNKADLYYREVPMPRIFGWNWYRNWKLRTAMCDMDGVLCEDWKKRELNCDPDFEDHVANVRPLFATQVPIHAIVTSRIEKYREGTVDWLNRHNIVYSHLFMHPAATAEERQASHDHAARKATVYKASLSASLFIESDVKQAAEIFKLTGKPVLCTDTMSMFKCED